MQVSNIQDEIQKWRCEALTKNGWRLKHSTLSKKPYPDQNVTTKRSANYVEA
jgi:hypothetical protein